MSIRAIAVMRPDLECWVWDHRVSERLPCELRVGCRPAAARPDSELLWLATVRDISGGGVGLILPRGVELGTWLVIELPGAGSGVGQTLLARVVHAKEQDGGAWHVGCEFERRIDAKSLEALAVFRRD
jgi:hypothetical protein